MASGKSAVDAPDSAFQTLWRRWQARRQRNRARLQSEVHFRLTREGTHFVGVLLFIFLGAVLREINLLILLAGAMIGLLILQWRFNSRTLVGLRAMRRIPKATSVGKQMDVELNIHNPKRWLGSWLVLVEEALSRTLPHEEKIREKGSAIVDEVRPRGKASCTYRLTFAQRGHYTIGPTKLSTRFPIGLGRGWRTLDNAAQIIVRPRLGELLPRSKKLFQTELQGHSQASASAGSNEAEFYGLRPWATGDSRRWIHWRTTARLGELSVRQFERRQQQQVCVLLDLHQAHPTSGGTQDADCEKAISFLATLAHSAVLQRRNKLAVSIAAERNFASPSILSAVLVDNLLDELATLRPTTQPDIARALQAISLPLLSNPYLLVVSTRENQMKDLRQAEAFHVEERILSRLKVRWLNVNQGDLKPYFHLDNRSIKG